MLAKEAGAKKVIALISEPHLHNGLKKIEIIPSPSEKQTISNRILSIVHEENILFITSLFENQAKVIELKVSENSQLVGIPLKDLQEKIPKDLIIAVIENKGQVMVGKGDRIISPLDTLILVSAPKHIQELQNLF